MTTSCMNRPEITKITFSAVSCTSCI